MTTVPAHDEPAATSDRPDPDHQAAATTRRTVLAGVGVAGAAAVLAACSSSGTSNGTGGASGSGGTSSGGTGGASAAPSGGSGGGGAQPTVLGPVSDVPVGGGKVYADQKVVVTQPTAGNFKCFTAVCTHMGCTVATVAGGTINCPCHGSQYHIADGTVAHGPAPAPLAPETITVSGGEISLA